MWWTDTKWWKYEYSKWKDLRGVSSEEWSYANPQYRSVWSISLDFPRMIHSPFCWFIRIFKLSPHIFPNHKNGPYKFVLQVHHSQLARLTNRLMSLMANGKWQTGQECRTTNNQTNQQTNCQLSSGMECTDWVATLKSPQTQFSFFILTSSHSLMGPALI